MGIDLKLKRFVLATDLDGTFLGGSAADRETLYRWIDQNRDTVGLVFVTGRDLPFIEDLYHSGTVPAPDFVIADVGTTVARRSPAGGLSPDVTLEQPIAAAWHGKARAVEQAMASVPGLRLQPTPFRQRRSYDICTDDFDPVDLDHVPALGVDVLVSDNRFVDILPRGVSKGPTLRRVLSSLGVEAQRVLSAGDTLNDLSMLTENVWSVAVGGSEPALLQRLPDAEDIYRAKRIGAGGILEAIAALNLHPTAGAKDAV